MIGLAEAIIPILFCAEGGGLGVKDGVVAGLEDVDVFKQGLVSEDVLKSEVFQQRGFVEFALECRNGGNGFLLGAKGEVAALVAIIQRLDTVAVAGKQQGFFFSVPQGECEHTVEFEQCGCTPVGNGMQDNLTVSLATKPIPSAF